MEKITIYVVILLTGIVTTSYAQRFKPNTLVKANHNAFKVDSLRFGGIYVHNEKNVYHNPDKRSSNSDIIEGNFVKDKSATINAFKKAFGNDKLHQLLGEGSMVVEYIVNDDGKILEVSFSLAKNTIITPNELDALEDYLKNDLSFKWRIRHIKKDGFYTINQVIRFSKILDGTLGG